MVTELNGKAVDLSTGDGNSRTLFHALPTSENEWLPRSFQIVSLLDVIRFKAGGYWALATLIQQATDIAIDNHARGEPKFDEQTTKLLMEDLNAAVHQCKGIGLTVSQQHVQSLIAEIETREPDCRLVEEKLRTIQTSIMFESKSELFFHVPKEQAKLYLNPQDRWEEIIQRFPSILNDVEEARKCFALMRYSASVFHSLQIVEIGLIELGTYIGVVDPTSGWTSVAQRLKRIIDTKYQDRSDFEKRNGAFLEQVQGTVEALKNAWRNKINHAHGRLTVMTGEEFHPDVAEEILLATRAFMRRLAQGLPPKPV